MGRGKRPRDDDLSSAISPGLGSAGCGRSEPFADGFPHDLCVRNPGVAVIKRGNSRVVPEKCAERPLHLLRT